MGPGPSDVPPRVLEALSRPTIGHLDPAFTALMDDLRRRLQAVFATKNEMTLAVSGTGSAGMETIFVNLIEPSDKVLIGINGVFGSRMVDVARRCGAEVASLEVPWGRPFEPDQIISEIKRLRPAVVALVHAETSTGVRQPIDGIAEVAHDVGALLVVDCVTSLGGMPVLIDEWGVDAAYSATQKCLSCPPGLAPITLSPRAVARIEARQTEVQSWYLDLTMVRRYWDEERFYHHTAPINMLYALNEALTLVLEEGLEARTVRHQEMHALLKEGLAGLGIEYLSADGYHLPMLNAVSVPTGVSDTVIRRALLNGYGIEIGGGLGVFRGTAWRIGLMGHTARRANVTLLVAALTDLLGRT